MANTPGSQLDHSGMVFIEETLRNLFREITPPVFFPSLWQKARLAINRACGRSIAKNTN